AQVGATFVPVNPAMGEREVEQILTLTAPDLVLGGESFRDIALGARLQGVVDKLARPVRLAPLVGFVTEALAAAPDTMVADDASLPVLVQYTSGTSGRPKGAVITHTAAVN